MWILLSFLTAVCTSAQDILAKRLSPRVSPYVIAWAWTFFSLPFLAAACLFERDVIVTPGFWPALAASGLILTASSVFLFKSIEAADLSQTVPILCLTPLFLLVTSPLIVGEFPGPLGMAGIVLIVLGSWLLFYRRGEEDLWMPLRRLVSSPGSRYMLFVAVLFSIGANVDKIGIRHSSPLVWSISLNAVVSAALGVIMLGKVRDPWTQVRGHWPTLVLIGLAVALVMVFQMNALRLAIVPYVIAIKRMSVVMSSAWGIVFFREQGGRKRILAALLMLAGVFVISFAN